MGMWLSSAILLPLGVFFTYKAMKDSAVFDLDAYKNVVRRLTGKLKRERVNFFCLSMPWRRMVSRSASMA